MDNLNIKDTLPFSKIELEHAETILSNIGYEDINSEENYSHIVYNKDFKEKYNLKRRLNHVDCRFENILFDGTDGTSLVLLDCTFNDCEIKNAGFESSDFTNSLFKSSKRKTTLMNSSFSKSNFNGVEFINVNSDACSFNYTSFYCANFRDSVLKHTNFEGAYFKRTSFVHTNMITSCIDFSEFEDVVISNSVFSIFGILWSFGGLEYIKQYKNEVELGVPNSDNYLSGHDFLNQLIEIEPYFYYKKDYFSLVNINIFLGEHEKSFLYVMEGMVHYLNTNNFRLLKYLCKLASKNNFFTKIQLRQLYYSLQKTAITKKMTIFEQKAFLSELNEIKKLLIDNPFCQPQIVINIETKIEEKDIFIEFLDYINKILSNTYSNSSHYITIRHNSPFSFEIFNSDNLQNLFALLLELINGIWGQIPQFNALLTACINYNKIRNNKSSTKELEDIELKLKREELLQQQINTELLLMEKKKKEIELNALEFDEESKSSIDIENQTNIKIPENSNFNNNIVAPINIKNKIVNMTYIINANETLPQILRNNIINVDCNL